MTNVEYLGYLLGSYNWTVAGPLWVATIAAVVLYYNVRWLTLRAAAMLAALALPHILLLLGVPAGLSLRRI